MMCGTSSSSETRTQLTEGEDQWSRCLVQVTDRPDVSIDEFKSGNESGAE